MHLGWRKPHETVINPIYYLGDVQQFSKDKLDKHVVGSVYEPCVHLIARVEVGGASPGTISLAVEENICPSFAELMGASGGVDAAWATNAHFCMQRRI